MMPRPAASVPSSQPTGDDHLLERRLPSGRVLTLRTDAAGEEIEIRSARGELDVRIVLGDTAPVVTLRGARLEVESPDVAFRCRNFDVKTSGDLTLSSERGVRIEADELRAKTEHDIHMNGAYIRLNCTDEAQIPLPLQLPVAEAAPCASCEDPHQP